MASSQADATPITPGNNSTHSKDVGWYTPTLTEISPAARELLEKYSNLPPERVIPHILEIVSPSPIVNDNGLLRFGKGAYADPSLYP